MNAFRADRFRNLLVGWLGLFMAYTGVLAQETNTTITGKVTESQTGQPLPFANVYLNNTTQGTTTDEKGRFRLPNVPLGTIELVASYLGYQPARQSVRLENSQPRVINLVLKSTGFTLADVTVKGKRDKTWERHYREFERELLGKTPFRSQCEILNPDVLQFTYQKSILKATAREPLVIENRAFGYRIQYDMQYFEVETNGAMYFAGATRFEELKPKDTRQADRWRSNRQRAYLGSTRHLMASLVAGTYEKEGFLVYQVNPRYPVQTGGVSLFQDIERHLLPVVTDSLIKPGRLSFERKLVTATPLKVFYNRIFSAYSPYRDAPYAYTEFRFPQGMSEITVDGRVTLPLGMLAMGYLGNDRFSLLLPANWEPSAASSQPDSVLASPIEGQILAADYRLDSMLRHWKLAHPYQAPSAFVHIDKPFYLTGDRIWLSAYVMEPVTAQLMFGEGALHADLLTPGGKVVQHQWLRINDGRATGDFRLSDTLATGIYRLRAYTDEDYAATRPAFERNITVYNVLNGPGQRSVGVEEELDVQFLPEGGRWVTNLPTRMGFKAVGQDGRGKTVSGRILDDQGREVTRFVSNRFGMGSVLLHPKADQTYQAEIQHNGKSQRFALPKLEPEGFVLLADVVSDTASLSIRILANVPQPDPVIYLTFQSYGQLVQRTKMKLQDGKARLTVPMAVFPPGLCQVTLYDAYGQPRAERMLFISEQIPSVEITVTADKPRYTPRERVVLNLKVNAQPEMSLVATLSAAVTDADQVPDDSTAADIRTHLLLTGDLRGRIEQPGFFFKDTTAATRRALDDLLLTQGWRRIGLRKPESPSDTLGGIVFSGRVVDERRNPIPFAELLVAAPGSSQAIPHSIGTNRYGRFRMAGLGITDTLQLLVQVMNTQFKSIKAIVETDTAGSVWSSAKVVAEPSPDWRRFQQQLDVARLRQESDPGLYRDKQAKILKEVTIKGYRPAERPESVERMSLHGTPDAVILFDERSPQFSNVYEMIRGRVAGVQVKQTMNGYTVNIRNAISFGVGNSMQIQAPLYLLDGSYLTETPEGNALMGLNPNDIERIEVLKNAATSAIYGARGGNGVIAFYTKRGNSKAKKVEPGVGLNQLALLGFSAHRDFYVPRYEDTPGAVLAEQSAPIDRRDVLYWKPVVQTDSKGASNLAFPLSDVVRTIRVMVQGITTDGRPVVGLAKLKVQ
ncbi:carboxypeptidase-like regulatory domain-containing protein [Larkinella humicola]|uniref:TonB-dependent receptor plug domain-containing protein n=1 Tax=Larkinella humicola TaxID=2607654 RepID=A0A5N1JK46_9BACT|nr:carboxypeptidase-like regulatory domain-containing protein [Larkinella humicola]KAA9353514.1 TonB-dependent receptor plug domain-containing protein [Larkinella humicola]